MKRSTAVELCLIVLMCSLLFIWLSGWKLWIASGVVGYGIGVLGDAAEKYIPWFREPIRGPR